MEDHSNDVVDALHNRLSDGCNTPSAAADLCTTGYDTLHSLIAHEDKFVDESQRLLLEKVGCISVRPMAHF